MSGPFRRIVTGIVFFVLVCIVGVAGYLLAGWNLADSLYMVIITIFGVGYGEVKPIESPALRAVTIGTIVAGYAAVIYTVGGFVQMLIDGELNRTLGARRMTRGIGRMQDHSIVCGYGRIGSMLSQHLAEAGHAFVVIDESADRIREAESHGHYVLNGNATDETILRQAGVERAACLASVLSDDAANLFVTITARELNENIKILARGENPATERKLLRSGASRVVLPTAIGAARIAHLITRPNAESLLGDTDAHFGLNEELSRLGLQVDELKLADSSLLIGQTVGHIEVRGNLGFLIIALKRVNGSIVMNPAPETQLTGGDTVVVLGHQHDLPQLAQRYALKRQMTYRGATH